MYGTRYLYERGERANLVRVQTDSYDGPLSLTEASRLELGSTAKLRALVSYLEVIAELHVRLASLPADSLRALPVASEDRLTRWAMDYLVRNPGSALRPMLDAAMQRTAWTVTGNVQFDTGRFADAEEHAAGGVGSDQDRRERLGRGDVGHGHFEKGGTVGNDGS